jgi:hypothetical protein
MIIWIIIIYGPLVYLFISFFTLGNNDKKQWSGYRDLRIEICKMPKYIDWRSSVLKKDDYKCQSCNKYGYPDYSGYSQKDQSILSKLEVDHIKSFGSIIISNKIANTKEASDCEELWDIDNGRVLCKYHHDQTKNSKRYKELNASRSQSFSNCS